MSAEPFKIECPCCQGTLLIDPELKQVLSHTPYKKPVKSLDDFMKDQKGRGAALEEKFKSAQDKEKHKMEILEKKIQLAKENPSEKEPPKIQWD